MDIKILLPEKYAGYLERFTKASYPGAFDDYCDTVAPFFSALESVPEESARAAEQLMELAGTMLPKRFGRRTAIFDIKSFLVLYIAPAALKRGTQPCLDFAQALTEQWNALYPQEKMSITPFAEIYAGFKNRIFGFEIGGLS